MKSILTPLKEFKFSDLSTKPYTQADYTDSEIQKLTELERIAGNYLDTRPLQLASIASALQVALQDEEIGTFNNNHMINISYFLEDELKSLGEVISLKEDVVYHLEAAKEKAAKSSQEASLSMSKGEIE